MKWWDEDKVLICLITLSVIVLCWILKGLCV